MSKLDVAYQAALAAAGKTVKRFSFKRNKAAPRVPLTEEERGSFDMDFTQKADYSHFLSPKLRRRGFKITMLESEPYDRLDRKGAIALYAWITDGDNDSAGRVEAEVYRSPEGKIIVNPYESEVDYRGLGLGQMAYEALYTHAFHYLGATRASGGESSSPAHRMHQRIAEKYGLTLKSKLDPDASDTSNDWDGAYEWWRYALRPLKKREA